MPELGLAGLLSWIAAGLVGGALARSLPPAAPRPGWWAALSVGAVGALAAGMAATALGFGGVAALAPGAALVALLGGALAVHLLRLGLGARRA
jgi:uncharacterized membrane protein YeaQ/YmgE (transglycosylase-associated protein family)